MNKQLLSLVAAAAACAGVMTAGAATAGHTESCPENPVECPLLEEPAEPEEDGPVSGPFHDGVITIHLTGERLGPEELLRRADAGPAHELNCNVIVVLEENLLPAGAEERTVDTEDWLSEQVNDLQGRAMESEPVLAVRELIGR